MGTSHLLRKLLYDSPPTNSTDSPPGQICSSACYSSDGCDPLCWSYCSENCFDKLPPPPPPTHHKVHTTFLITGVVLSSVFLLVFFYAIYYKFYSAASRNRRSLQDQRNETVNEDFLDEDHGPVLDHPIWYINTIGLQQSVINSITVCKYKRGYGLIEGTDCSVCLNEFRDDETLRLLPKCNHAFHIPCIDTWLRSHTNCPMCRAPIVASPARGGGVSGEGTSESMRTGEETRIGISENDQESERELEGGDGEVRVVSEEESELEDVNRRKSDELLNGEGVEEGIQPIRRSVSLDSLSAFKISQALANVCPMESQRNSRRGLVKENESDMDIVLKRSDGSNQNQSLLRFMASSSIGRSLQIGPSSLKRSLSCGGKLFLARYGRNSSSVLPL